MPLKDENPTTQSYYTPSPKELEQSAEFASAPHPQEEANVKAAQLDLYNNRIEFDGGWLSALSQEEVKALTPKTEVLAQAATSNQVEKNVEEYPSYIEDYHNPQVTPGRLAEEREIDQFSGKLAEQMHEVIGPWVQRLRDNAKQ